MSSQREGVKNMDGVRRDIQNYFSCLKQGKYRLIRDRGKYYPLPVQKSERLLTKNISPLFGRSNHICTLHLTTARA
jgi:hypothetical protein